MTEPTATISSLPEPQPAPDLCQPFLGPLPISGASVTVMTTSGTPLTICSSNPIAARIDELHFELGEGPQWAAARTGELSMITDVPAGSHREWPVLGAALSELAIGALFCVPLRMGAVTVGVATLYSDRPRELTEDQQRTALAIGSAIASTAVHQAMSLATDDTLTETARMPALRREVHQATGMLIVQLDASATVAYARLQAYAFANGRTVQAVAHDVVSGTLVFDDNTQ
jgi:GAF domain-containing protein